MQRRAFITLLGGAAVWPLAASAQHGSAVPVVGVLMAGEEKAPDSQALITAFRKGFAELGWNDGQNVRVDYRWAAGNSNLMRQYVAELVALTPDVIVANSTPVVTEFKEVTKSIPIVCALVQDPVGLGLVKSLSRPGGNITGFTFINPDLIGKWVGLLKDVMPRMTGAALLFNPMTTPFYYDFLREVEAARLAGPIELRPIPVTTPGELATTVDNLMRSPGNGLIISPDPFNRVHIKEIAQLTGKYRLPAISVYQPFVMEGGLMAYGPDTADIFRRSAAYVDRILKGTKAADLPIQQPTKFEFFINLKSAKELGLTVPLTLQIAADEVIE